MTARTAARSPEDILGEIDAESRRLLYDLGEDLGTVIQREDRNLGKTYRQLRVNITRASRALGRGDGREGLRRLIQAQENLDELAAKVTAVKWPRADLMHLISRTRKDIATAEGITRRDVSRSLYRGAARRPKTMSDTLRKRTIKLAHDKPELRPHLLPLLREAKEATTKKTARPLDLVKEFTKNPTHENKAELSDYGVNWLREEARKQGYDQNDIDALYREEMQRMRNLNISPRPDGWAQYRKVSRRGSEYALTAKMRMALFMIYVSHHLI
jgi:hypothetical protein